MRQLLSGTMNSVKLLGNPIQRNALSKVTASIAKTVIRSWPLNAYMEGREEIWSMDGDDQTKIVSAYTVSGDYVGDLSFAKFLIGQTVRPELKSPELTVCSIGYSKVKNAWAGWSHRCFTLFGIGDRVFDVAYGNGNTLSTEHGAEIITNMEQARRAAIAFADYVS